MPDAGTQTPALTGLPGGNPGATRLRHLLAGPDFLVMPCCFDGLSARLIKKDERLRAVSHAK